MAKLYRPGGPRQGEPCEVDVTRTGLNVTADGLTFPLPYEALDGKIVGFEDAWVALSATTPEGTIEVWVERGFLSQLEQYGNSFSPGFKSRFAALKGEKRKRDATRWGLRVAGLAFVVFLGWFVFGGAMTNLVVKAIPIAVEEAIGEAAVSEVTTQYAPCADGPLVDAVADILDALVKEVPDSGYTFELRVLKSDEVNAFALPGGKVFVLSGLLELSEDPSEVAAVMGHEMQHVLGRHGLRGMVQQAGIGLALTALLGDASALVGLLGEAAGKLGALKFGRDQERDADVVGLELLAGAGFDPGGAERFFGKLAEESGELGGRIESAAALVSTHPASTERMQRLADLSADLSRPERPHLHDLDWATLKSSCVAGVTPDADAD